MTMARPCQIDTCDRAAKRVGYCYSHYYRLRRHGDPLAGGTHWNAAKSFIEDHVEWDGGDCLIWPFQRDAAGYARVRWAGRDQIASRVMCVLAHGDPPFDGAQAAHKCGRGHLGCVHPKHLRWASPHENNMDKVDHGTAARGERAWCSKLTEQDVRSIRRLISSGTTQRAIAAKFGISQSSVCSIGKYENWGWLK